MNNEPTETRENPAFRVVLAQAINVWNEYENGDAGWSFDEADAILALPEMQWLRQFLVDTLNTDFLSAYQAELVGEVPSALLSWAEIESDWNDATGDQERKRQAIKHALRNDQFLKVVKPREAQ